MFQKIRQHLSLKITYFVAFFVFLILAGLGTYFTFYIYKAVEEKFGLALEHVALTAALQIDPKEHAKVQNAKSPSFQKIRDILTRVRDANGLTPETIYTLKKVARNSYAFVVMTHKKPFVGDIYHPPKENQGTIEKALHGQSGYTHLYTDAHGEWISGYAPIGSPSGRVTGVLAVDFRVDRFLAEARLELLNFAAIGGFLVILLLSFSYVLGKKISTPIVKASQAARRLSEGDYSFRMKVESADETGQLIHSINLLSESLQERFLLLKYVSPHTLEMIRMMQSGQVSADGELRKLAILFSDIRGYTRYAERHEPKTVVNTLNKMLGLEAEIIAKYNGKIDKFVGDEVVAIFHEEEGIPLALKAALEIRQKIEELAISDGESSYLHVGIGISFGEVVFGNIGSADRKDFTITGSNVNLAARLCSAAKAGEILVSSNVYHIIQQNGGAGFSFQLKGRARIKGFRELMHVYSLIEAGLAAKNEKE